ncbi:MAG TPA: hypothetical protein VGP21_02475 [Opitutaceae bacterium]|jgi:hypothetical protein|nr:hypothetical protein [Opitutaceae bacterium]
MVGIVAGVADPGLSAVALAKADTGLSEAGYIRNVLIYALTRRKKGRAKSPGLIIC